MLTDTSLGIISEDEAADLKGAVSAEVLEVMTKAEAGAAKHEEATAAEERKEVVVTQPEGGGVKEEERVVKVVKKPVEVLSEDEAKVARWFDAARGGADDTTWTPMQAAYSSTPKDGIQPSWEPKGRAAYSSPAAMPRFEGMDITSRWVLPEHKGFRRYEGSLPVDYRSAEEIARAAVFRRTAAK